VKKAKTTVASAKNNLSRYLAYVRRGGRVTIYNRDTPVAELLPAVRGPGALAKDDDWLARLEREGIVRRGPGEVADELLKPPPGRKARVLDALLEERGAGR
jgi:prevent-host-death family protein